MEAIDPKLVAQLAKLIEMTYNVLYAVIAMTAAVTWFGDGTSNGSFVTLTELNNTFEGNF